MANHVSAEKAIRQIKKRTALNRARKSRVASFIKKVDAAVAKKDVAEAASALKIAQSEIMRGVTKGIFKLNTASRTVSRLAARVKAIAA